MRKCLWLLASLLFVSGCTSDDASSGKDSGGDAGNIVCESGEHVYADDCEADSLASCGSHDNDCTKLAGWKAGDCTGGKCVASECADGYDLKDGVCASGNASSECGEGKHSHESACEDDSLENCGGHGNDCTKEEGWKAGDCTGGKCVASECADGYELKDGACVSGTAAPTECEAGKHAFDEGCEDDSDENCGSHGNKCSELEGWKAGACTEGKCVATECAADYELKDGKCEAAGSECEAGKHAFDDGCEDDSDENCGSHGNKCAELEGWKAGACTEGKCVASECAADYELKDGKCVSTTAVGCTVDQYEQGGKCVDNTLENCGKQGNDCKALEGWADGKCTAGECVATKCSSGYKVSNGLCVKEGVSCNKDEHYYNGGCEKNSVDNCGSHNNACLSKTGWGEAECTDGKCVLKKCKTGLCIQNNACVEGVDITACGADGNVCQACGVNQSCVKGACQDKGSQPQCKSNQHMWDGKCEDDTVSNCGSHGNDCAKADGWKTGTCTGGKCVVGMCNSGYCISAHVCVEGNSNVNACGVIGKQCFVCEPNQDCINGVCTDKTLNCAANQHVWNGKCEDDTVNNCGSHGNDCTKAEGWNQGLCSNKKCVVSRCNQSYCIKNGVCVDGMSNVNACGGIGKQCIACDANQTCSEGICKDKEIKCAANQHVWNGGCEDDTVNNCGSHGNNCAAVIVGWADGSCSGGKCVAAVCSGGYCVAGGSCLAGASNPNACGISGNKCNVCGANQSCSAGKCINNSSCPSGMFPCGNDGNCCTEPNCKGTCLK